MRWVTVVAAAAVLTLGVFVAAIPQASIEARAHAAPFAQDSDDDDSDALAQQQEDEEWQEQQDQDNEQGSAAAPRLPATDGAIRARGRNSRTRRPSNRRKLDEQLAQSDQQPGN